MSRTPTVPRGPSVRSRQAAPSRRSRESPSEPVTYLFVYGTSLPGQQDHRWIAGLPCTPASVRGALYRGPRNRPGLVPDPDGRPVRGLLVEAPPNLLALLDTLEGVGAGPFRRQSVPAASLMRAINAECYVLDRFRAIGFRLARAQDWRDLIP